MPVDRQHHGGYGRQGSNPGAHGQKISTSTEKMDEHQQNHGGRLSTELKFLLSSLVMSH